jgi:hypothetical protein
MERLISFYAPSPTVFQVCFDSQLRTNKEYLAAKEKYNDEERYRIATERSAWDEEQRKIENEKQRSESEKTG